MSPDELLRRLLGCVYADAGGLSDRVRRRRRLLAEYWYASHLRQYLDLATVLGPEWHAEVVKLFAAYADACDRFLDRAESPGIDQSAAWEVAGAALEVVRVVDEDMTGYDTAVTSGDRVAADACVCRALGRFFDWADNDRVRAYVYVLSGEPLTTELVKVEKSRLLDRIDECRTRLAGEIGELLG